MSPALADANNGNWRTARRWQRMLGGAPRARVVKRWPDALASGSDRVMLALHARRSADSIAAWARARGARARAPGLGVALTGTDLYRDIRTDASARRSLRLAHRLVVLQDQAPRALPARLRGRAEVVFQSTTGRRRLRKGARRLRAVMVGHLREEKMPQTLFAAARLLRTDPRIRIDHIGAALDEALGAQARATMRECPGYRWLGPLPHEATRRRIQRAHVLVHASRMEGGAHVVLEAVRSGTPVIASRIPGNVGMLGARYGGYFRTGSAADLARLLRRAADGLAAPGGGWLARLRGQCARREPLFRPAGERAALRRVVAALGRGD